jgi:hypothetical protein
MAKQAVKSSTASLIANIKDWHALLIIAAAVLVFFRDILLQKAFFWEDFIYFYYPTRNFGAVSFANGELPLWNPYTFNGLPFQADIQSALFYIPNLLLTFFVHGDRLSAYWFEVWIIMHYIIAGTCMYFLAKSYGLERIYALFSGLVYALCGFMIAHTMHYTIISAAAWLPLVVLLFWKSLSQKSLLHMITAGLVLSLAILAGSPQITLYILFFLFLVFLFEFFSQMKQHGIRSSLGMIPYAAGAMIIALGITALQLFPTMELAPYTHRAELTYENSLESSMHWEQLLTMLIPNFFGTRGAQGSTFWLAAEYSLYWETCFYLGVASVVFIVFALPLMRSDRRSLFLLSVMIFSLLYALGDRFILHKLFFTYVPGFDTFRAIGRITLLLSVAGSVLAGIGLKSMLTIAQTNKRLTMKILTIISAGGILLWLAVQMGWLQPGGQAATTQQIHQIASTAASTNIVLLLAMCVVIFLFTRERLSHVTAVVSVFILHVVDIHIFGFDQNNGTVNPDDYYRRTAQLVNMLKEDGKDEFFRVNSRQGSAMILDRNQGMVDRIFLMEGFTPLALQRTLPPGKNWDRICDLMNAKYRIALDEQQHTMSLRQVQTYLPRAFMVYKTIAIQNEDSAKSFMERDNFNPRHIAVFEEEPTIHPDTLLDAENWSAAITSYSLNAISLSVSTPVDGFLVLSEIYYPGWKAYIDGNEQPIYRANWNLRAITLRSGTHTVVVRFEPKSLRTGTMISIATLGLSIGGVVYFRAKRHKLADA